MPSQAPVVLPSGEPTDGDSDKFAYTFPVQSAVLCEQGGKWYVSRILSAERRAGRSHYYVHYQGWPVKWDMWVDEDIVREDTPRNREIYQAGNHTSKSKKKAKMATAAAPTKAEKTPKPAGQRSKKSKRSLTDDPTVEMDASNIDANETDDTALTSESSTTFTLPGALKYMLLTDWERITRQSSLVPLPRQPNIQTLLQSFTDSHTNTGRVPQLVVREVCHGLRTWFDQCLPTVLLYNFERPQYFDTTKASDSSAMPSSLYGAEHLLRLLLKLPALLLATDSLSAADKSMLVRVCNELCKYVTERSDELFVRVYDYQDKDYISRVAQVTAQLGLQPNLQPVSIASTNSTNSNSGSSASVGSAPSRSSSSVTSTPSAPAPASTAAAGR